MYRESQLFVCQMSLYSMRGIERDEEPLPLVSISARDLPLSKKNDERFSSYVILSRYHRLIM